MANLILDDQFDEFPAEKMNVPLWSRNSPINKLMEELPGRL